MKYLLLFLFPLTCGASAYEFLAPHVVVFKEKGNISPKHRFFWKKENGLLRDKKGKILREPDITCYEYVILSKPFAPGEKRLMGTTTVQYDPGKPTQIFKLNQLGYGTCQKKKYAYMGAWLGKAGPLPLKHLAGKTFEIRRSADNRCVFKNTLKLRREDPLYQGKTPFTGEEVLELDLSEFNTPGKYYFYVENIGRSMDFPIGSETLNEAFYIHARGLYHKRCGIAKAAPFTAWPSSSCHPTVIRGLFPGNARHYRKGKGEKDFGFFDRQGNRIEVKHFELIRQNARFLKKEKITAPGGWHDAADYDRRPYHLQIVRNLAAVYLMKPENFIDGQLHIPESGNGLPDILDEAAWGLKHLLTVQRPDGGTGTWFETTGHPAPGEGLPHKEKRTYYVSYPSCNGTLEYADAASMLALALKKAGGSQEAERYLASAQKAWEFAQNPRNRHAAAFIYKGKVIYYREEADLDAETLVSCGSNLYLLTGEKKYLLPLLKQQKQLLSQFNKNFWRWSPLCWMTLQQVPELLPFFNEYKKVICRNAEKMLPDQENAYPYRTLWHAPDAGWVHAMAWGNYHPLRRAMTLIAAHKLTGEEKYLTGVYLANDFHNGANPLGRTMTSGLGQIYPAVFLDLVSYADHIGEFVPGITPYGNTFGLDRNVVKIVYKENAADLPVFRRCTALEFLSVPASEYSVWETIAPAAVTTGYLIEKPSLPSPESKKRKPAADYRQLPGYRALP